MEKKLLMELLKNYQSFMYAHYVQDEIKDYAYLEEVADAILTLNKALVSRSKNGGAEKNLLKGYQIETFDEGAYLHFFTEAKDKRGALRNLLKNSWDFKNCTNDKREWRITIKELK